MPKWLAIMFGQPEIGSSMDTPMNVMMNHLVLSHIVTLNFVQHYFRRNENGKVRGNSELL